MNPKAKKFSEYISLNMNKDAFIIKQLNDKVQTTLFYVNIKIAEENNFLKLLIVTDVSQNILFRLNLVENLSVKNQTDRLYTIINLLNQRYPVFKFYVAEDETNIILELTHVAHDDFFEPIILESHIVWLVEKCPEILATLQEIL